MHLQLASDAPVLLRAAAASLLVLHVGGATVGMASGAVTLAARKGGRLHRRAGNVFFVAMLAMSGVGAVVSPMFPDRISALAGAFAFYLTVTGWMAVRRPAMSVGRFETGAALGIFLLAGLAAWVAGIGARSPGGLIDELPYQIAAVLTGLSLFCAWLDLRMIRAGGAAGPVRVRRHLWRMCVALFIAFGSAAGQPKVVHLLPAAVRHSALLIFSPALIVLALMIFWLIRTRMPPRRARVLAVA
jgi:uncharacterized membrane protein